MVSYPNAKINLGLRVYGLREDGFHNIETVFFPCRQLRDILEIVPSHDGRTHVTMYGLPVGGSAGEALEPEENLCFKAWSMLNAAYRIPPADIYLYKNIPSGAGLGGGSADAAFALKMLSEMNGLTLAPAALEAFAARLGSDCAFFIHNRPALATGRGEILTPIKLDLGLYDIRIVTSDIHVSTADAYRSLKGYPSVPQTPSELSPGHIVAQKTESWRATLVNDFEETVFAMYPELAQTKQRLYDEGAVYASMSGSGSAVYGLFTNLGLVCHCVPQRHLGRG